MRVPEPSSAFERRPILSTLAVAGAVNLRDGSSQRV
jgi:hypothetical protein